MSCPSKRIVPAVGSSRRRISRAVVDLPQPDSPTIPSVSPSADGERDVFDRMHLRGSSREHALLDRELLRHVLELDERRAIGCRLLDAHPATPSRIALRSAQPCSFASSREHAAVGVAAG